jgi:hypothetical protein
MHRTLNRAKLAASLTELAEAGSPVDMSVADTEDQHVGVEIEQVGGVHDSMVFELPGGLAGYILDMAFTNQTSRTIYCRDIDLRLPWEDSLFNWMQDPREAGRSELYRFPGRNPLQYPRDEVINHVLLDDGALTSMRPLRGLLLATGRPMPESLFHGQWLVATLAILASDHAEYTSAIRLWTERLEINPKRATRKYDLHGEPVGYNVGSPVAPCNEPGALDLEIGKSATRPGRRSPFTA